MAQLDDILPEYKSVSQMPTIAELVYWADKKEVNVDTAISAERRKKYKAIDGEGMVWLVRNPAVWEYKDGSYLRPAPELQGHISSFRKVKKTAPKAENQTGDWF